MKHTLQPGGMPNVKTFEPPEAQPRRALFTQSARISAALTSSCHTRTANIFVAADLLPRQIWQLATKIFQFDDTGGNDEIGLDPALLRAPATWRKSR
jgi:hypothetical protein